MSSTGDIYSWYDAKAQKLKSLCTLYADRESLNIFLQHLFEIRPQHSSELMLRHPCQHGRRNWGHRGHVSPNFSNIRAKCSFSCNLVALLENFGNAKMNRKIRVSCDFRRSEFQDFPGKHALGPPSWVSPPD